MELLKKVQNLRARPKTIPFQQFQRQLSNRLNPLRDSLKSYKK
jgi:hypothetical protein